MRALGRLRTVVVGAVLMWGLASGRAAAQDPPAVFVGGLGGIAALSADARSLIAPEATAVSTYAAENGSALNLFAGLHAHEYAAVQVNYIWNRNALTLGAVRFSGDLAGFYEQQRDSTQHALVGDLLVYFRERRSRVRPYLSAGLGAVRFTSRATQDALVRLSLAPPPDIEATRVMLRVAVGLDVALGEGWRFRYSFSESLSGNPISEALSPPAPRGLMNFQNLFGILRQF